MHNNDEILKVLETYNYSINIQRDYTNKEKINSYMPTYKNMHLIHKYIDNIISANKKSFLLSGAYGTGKSFLVSIILNLLDKDSKLEKNDPLFEKSIKHYSETETLISQVSDKKYLYVFPEDNFPDFKQAVTLGIIKAANKYNINLSLPTIFELIREKIKKWESNYNNIFDNFIILLKKRELTIEKFNGEINNNNAYYISIFEECYKDLFAGEKFIPLGSINRIGDILFEFEKVVLNSTNYDGIIYIFDEFGRYLETNIKKIDVKEIQDIAEYCNNKDCSSSFFAITHKDIFQYSSKIYQEDIRNEWEKVSGRFNREHLVYEKQNIIDIIENVLTKTDKYDKFRNENISIFEEYERRINFNKNTNGLGSEPKILLKKYYPLNFLAVKVLPDLSQKIAQNERTLFSFLCGDEKNGLKNMDFNIKNRSLNLISFPELFDYFERNFSFLDKESIENKVYLNTKSILNKLTDTLEIRLIKSLAIIYILNNFNEIKPEKDTISFILDIEENLLDKTINQLIEKDYIVYREHSKLYKIRDEININIDKEIKKEVSVLKKFDFSNSLSEVIPLGYYYPIEYNINNKITRYLNQYYIDINNISALDKIKSKSDGNIIYLFNTEEKIIDILNIIKSYGEIGIFIYNKTSILDVENELSEIEAINNIIRLKSILIENDTVKQEILSYKLELKETISKSLERYFDLKKCNVFVREQEYSNFDLMSVTTRYLNNKFSKYFERYQIGYELINRNKLTPQIKKIRIDLLEKIEKGELYDYNFNHTAAENSVARNILKNTGLFYNKLEFKNSNFEEMYLEILQKIKESISLADLYSEYCSFNSQYGFRKGVFSFILMLIIIKNRSDIVMVDENKNELKVSAKNINDFEEKPHKYQITFIRFDANKKKFLDKIINLFELYTENNLEISQSSKALSGFKNFLLALPKFLLVKKYQNSELRKILKGILAQNNSMEFWFIKLPKIYDISNLDSLFEKFLKDIEFLKNEEQNLKYLVIDKIKNAFLLKNGINDLIEWRENTVNKTFEYYNYIYQIDKKEFKNERIFLANFTEKVLGFDYYNWRSETDFENFYTKISKQNILSKENQENSKKISIFDGKTEKYINISEIEESSIGKILKSKIKSDLNNIGLSVSEEEKKKILLEILLEN